MSAAEHARPLMVDAEGAARLFAVSLRTWRRMDYRGRIPAGVTLVQRKLWSVKTLENWRDLGCPSREEFERLTAESETVKT